MGDLTAYFQVDGNEEIIGEKEEYKLKEVEICKVSIEKKEDQKNMKNEIFKELGYKVIRIPYFIQLTNKVVYDLFGVNVKEKLFDENIPSLNIESRNTPAYLCPMGIRRMAIDFLDKSTEQLNVNIEYLQKICDEHKYKTLTVGLTYLIDEINYVTENL